MSDEIKNDETEETASDAEARTSESEASAPKKKKKKKKRKEPLAEPAAKEAEAPAPALDSTGAERPAFLEWFPKDPELDTLVRAFEIGNYALIRERAPALAANAESEKVRAAARELLARIEPDPLMKYLLAGALLLLLFLVFFAYQSHAH